MSDEDAPRTSRDIARNLLFGLLALQNNFISRAQLLAAFNAWVEDKSQSIAALRRSHRAWGPIWRSR